MQRLRIRRADGRSVLAAADDLKFLLTTLNGEHGPRRSPSRGPERAPEERGQADGAGPANCAGDSPAV